MDKYINISQLAKKIGLINSKTKEPSNYILRYWEKEFKQIKPLIIKKRRYYSKKDIEIIKLIRYLLKDKGMTIKGVKNVLKSNINNLDDYDSFSLKASYQKDKIIINSKKILGKLKQLKKYGKKNSS